VRGNRRRWHPADTLGLAIGQADLLVTPLQMARVMAAIANGGQLVTPHFAGEAGPVAMSDAPSFRAIFPHPDPQQIPDLHPATLAQIRNGLDMVVNHPAGTAFKSVHMKEVNIAGKTGTAESGGSDHAWFAGYVPAEQPRVAFVVVLEHGGSGGKAAGPVAKNFVKCLLDLGLLTPSTDLARDSDR
jgi:penicillin-binding protein 2